MVAFSLSFLPVAVVTLFARRPLSRCRSPATSGNDGPPCRVFRFNPGNASSIFMTIDERFPSPNSTFPIVKGKHTFQCTVGGFNPMSTKRNTQLLLGSMSYYEVIAETGETDTEASVAAKADRFRWCPVFFPLLTHYSVLSDRPEVSLR